MAAQVQDRSRIARGASDGEWVAGLAEAGLAGAGGKWVEPKTPLLSTFEDECGMCGNESGMKRVWQA